MNFKFLNNIFNINKIQYRYIYMTTMTVLEHQLSSNIIVVVIYNFDIFLVYVAPKTMVYF